MGIPIPEFKVLLYGPTFHPAGIRARARFEGSTLAVSARAGFFLVTPDLITLRTGGFDGRQWLISWVAPEGTYSAMLQNEEALAAFIELAPPELSRQLTQVHDSLTRSGRRLRVALGLFALIALTLLGLLWLKADRIAHWAVSHISIHQERQLGDIAFNQLRPSLTLLRRSPVVDAITTIGRRLTDESTYTYHFHIAVDPRINAYALPGGHIVINTGLLKSADQADEVAGVLAHEISHVELRHSLRNLVHSLGWRALLAAVTGDYTGKVWNDMATRLIDLGYSRELESEADREALEILRRGHVAPYGMESYFIKMSHRQTSPPALLSSHPTDAARLAALRKAISLRPADDPYPLDVDWERVRMDL